MDTSGRRIPVAVVWARAAAVTAALAAVVAAPVFSTSAGPSVVQASGIRPPAAGSPAVGSPAADLPAAGPSGAAIGDTVAARAVAEAAAIDLLAAGTGVSAASSARPGPNERRVRDTELRTRWVRADELRVTGSADASTRCRQCAGSAVTVQVVYAYGTERLTVRNTARASASCVTCGSSALSVQVVVTDVPVGRDLVVSNAATATGTWCLGCTSAAAAVQVVVEDPQLRQLDEAGRTRLAGVGADMGVLLARTATDSAQARWRLTAGEVTERLQADGRRLVLILREELGGTVVSQGIVVRMA